MNVTLRGRLASPAGRVGGGLVLLAVAILTIGSVAGAGPTGPASWYHVAAVRTSGEGRVQLDLWTRGHEAVYIERPGTEVAADLRCIAGSFIQQGPTGRVVRKPADPQRCYDLATDPLLGFVRAAQASDFVPSTEPQGGGATAAVFTARDAGAHLQTVVIDPIRRVPLRAVFRNGDVWTWEYVAPTDDSPPPPPPAEQARTETYTDLTPEAAAPELGLTAVPMAIANRPLLALFRYDSGAPASSDVGPPRVTSTYAIWGEAGDLEGTGQIQLIVTDYPPPPDGLGIEELGGAISLRLDEGGRQVLIFAPDRATLEVAVRALRPGLKLPEAGR